MSQTIFITGATAGIGLEAARALATSGHHLLVHGRSAAKVETLVATLRGASHSGSVEGFVADLSRRDDVEALAESVASAHERLDVLINNAGVYKTSAPRTPDGQDVRFVVNTIAPYVLTKRLLPRLGERGRVVNLSSAAQEPVSLAALAGEERLDDFAAYAQSKLALTMWSCQLGRTHGDSGPLFVAVNPGSLLATRMVKEGFGVAGKDVRIGSDIVARAAVSDEFQAAQGAYFDNDAGRFGPPHPDALDEAKCEALLARLEAMT